MRIEDIQVGDVVRFREWDDIRREFKGSADVIYCKFHFVSEMKELCGTEFTVTGIDVDLIRGHSTGWSVSADMLEPAFPVSEIEESDMDLETILC